jgi:hypothetical protein
MPLDFSKPLIYNDDVFGRLYNQQKATYHHKSQLFPGKHAILVEDGEIYYCDENGLEAGNFEPSVSNEEPERPEEIPNEPRCNCGNFFEACQFPNCASGSQVV